MDVTASEITSIWENTDFWDVLPCRLAKNYGRFERLQYLHFQCQTVQGQSRLQPFETPGTVSQSTSSNSFTYTTVRTSNLELAVKLLFRFFFGDLFKYTDFIRLIIEKIQNVGVKKIIQYSFRAEVASEVTKVATPSTALQKSVSFRELRVLSFCEIMTMQSDHAKSRQSVIIPPGAWVHQPNNECNIRLCNRRQILIPRHKENKPFCKTRFHVQLFRKQKRSRFLHWTCRSSC